MLTLEQLTKYEPEQIFSTGIVDDRRLHNETVRWVAIRGWHTDWTIYYHLAGMNPQQVAQVGSKILSAEVIKDLVPCDIDALKRYRI